MNAVEEKYVLRDSETWRDPYTSYKYLRDYEPVHRVQHHLHGTFWVLSRFDDVFDAVRNPAVFC